MNRRQGILWMADPLRAEGRIPKLEEPGIQTLIFHEDERYFLQAQAALQRARQRWSWVCVAAEGAAAGVAAALAAQLPVDRLALRRGGVFCALPRQQAQLRRINAFARRNLALIAAPVLLAECDAAEIQGWLRGLGHGEICALDGESAREYWPRGLCAPWARLGENNLLIPGKCV